PGPRGFPQERHDRGRARRASGGGPERVEGPEAPGEEPPPMSIRAVFDCMLFLQAATNDAGPAFACFQLVDDGRLTLCLSPEILAEVRDVLNRPKIRRKFPHLTEDRVEEFLASAQAKGIMLDEVPKEFRYARDPDDEPYINLAIAVGAQYLVSRDSDLLDL